MPGPQRGEIVRQMGDALRAKLQLLGKLVRTELMYLKNKQNRTTTVLNIFTMFCDI